MSALPLRWSSQTKIAPPPGTATAMGLLWSKSGCRHTSAPLLPHVNSTGAADSTWGNNGALVCLQPDFDQSKPIAVAAIAGKACGWFAPERIAPLTGHAG